MANVYKLVAAPHLLPAGDFKGHLETVTFIAANENESHKWWAVNVGTFDRLCSVYHLATNRKLNCSHPWSTSGAG